MSTSTQLETWATKNVEHFIGVYAADQLPSRISAPSCLIVNYDPASLPGSHWVACWVQKRSVYWFDSFGLAPDADDLILGHRTFFTSWLASICGPLGLQSYSWNTLDLQSLAAKTCGHYSLWFCRNGPLVGWRQFTSDTTSNDARIRDLVRL